MPFILGITFVLFHMVVCAFESELLDLLCRAYLRDLIETGVEKSMQLNLGMLSAVLDTHFHLQSFNFWFPNMRMEVAGDSNSVLTVLLSKGLLSLFIHLLSFIVVGHLESLWYSCVCWTCRCGMIVKVRTYQSWTCSCLFSPDLTL